MERLASLGIPAAAIVRMGTLNGAVLVGGERELGTVEAGKLADLLLLDADPTVDVRNVRRMRLVVKGGQLIDRGLLDLPVNHRTRP